MSTVSLENSERVHFSNLLAKTLEASTWLSVPDFMSKYEISPSTAHWLVDIESLTERLQMHTDAFSVKVLYQGDELIKTSTSSDQTAIAVSQMRNVELNHATTPWVFASSILPSALCEHEFAALGTKPLGKILFNDARFSRQPFELVYLPQTHPFAQHYNSPYDLVGRRSEFHFLTYTLLVTEIFLPDSPAYKNSEVR